MSTTVELRPNFQISAQNFAAVPSGTLIAVTSDNSLTTYINCTGTTLSRFVCGVDNYTIPSGTIVRRVRLDAYLHSSGIGNMHTQACIQSTAGRNGIVATYGVYAPAWQRFQGPWNNLTPEGIPWNQTDINGVHAFIQDDRTGVSDTQCAELYVVVETNDLPTCVVNDPTGTITLTTRPLVDWTYSDTESDPQYSYHVKVFDHATWSAGGFDPQTSTALIDSGEVFSSDSSYQPTVDLPNATNYRAYVLVSQVLDGRAGYATWAYSGFDQGVVYPNPPTLAVSPQPANGRTQLIIQGTDTLSAWTAFNLSGVVEFSDDFGATWELVRYGDNITLSGTEAATIYDYEAPPTARMYRARIVAFQAPYTLAGSNCTPVTGTLSTSGWWLKDPFQIIAPLSDLAGNVAFPSNPRKIVERSGTFYGLNRKLPVVVSDAIGGQDGTLVLQLLQGAPWPTVEALIQLPWALLLVDPYGEQHYIRCPQDRSWDITVAAAGPARTVTLPYIEVDRP